jgi:ssDNA-specific exonuclease RecJ
MLAKPKQVEVKPEPKDTKLVKSDKYLLQKFKREWDQICEMVQPPEDLDFVCFKDMLVHMGMLTEQQALTESRESSLLYDVWYSLSQLRGQ